MSEYRELLDEMGRLGEELRNEYDAAERFVKHGSPEKVLLNAKAAQAFIDAALHESGHDTRCPCGDCYTLKRRAVRMLTGVTKA